MCMAGNLWRTSVAGEVGVALGKVRGSLSVLERFVLSGVCEATVVVDGDECWLVCVFEYVCVSMCVHMCARVCIYAS